MIPVRNVLPGDVVELLDKWAVVTEVRSDMVRRQGRVRQYFTITGIIEGGSVRTAEFLWSTFLRKA